MKDYEDIFDALGPTGNRIKRSHIEEEDCCSMFDSVYEFENYCENCGYEGPLEARSKGYTCPDCRYLVLPTE